MASNQDFLGTGWAFPPQFSSNKQSVNLCKDEVDIKQSLTILLSTMPGERMMHPTYGCHLHRMVFAELTPTTLTQIKNCIKDAVLRFEPRIDLLAVTIESHPQQGLLLIKLSYQIIATNTADNMVYPFYLQEGTLIDTSLTVRRE